MRRFGVVAVLVLLAIGIFYFVSSSLLEAGQRSKMKRGLADIRSLGRFVEAHRATTGCYPDGSSIEDLARALAPTRIPIQDIWSAPLLYSGSCHRYYIASSGKNMRLEKPLLAYTDIRRTTSFDDDIVLSNGVFLRVPAWIDAR